MLTLLAIVVTFGVHSLVDWTWFVPGVAIPALLCAGWLAGRGPVTETFGPRRRRAAPPRSSRGGRAGRPGAAGRLADVAAAALRRRRRGGAQRGRGQRLPQARERVSRALELNPLSVEPLNERAAVESAAGDLAAARRALEQAVRRQPSDPETWLRLAEFELTTAGRPAAARRAVGAALHLDPRSPAGQALFLEALRRRRPRRRPARWRPSRRCRPPPRGGDPARAPHPRSRRSPRPDARPRARRARRRGAGGRALRFATLDDQSFWLDEAYTVRLLDQPLGDMLRDLPDQESAPPVYYLLAWAWGHVLGFGEAGLRSLSALLGTLTIPVAYRRADAAGGARRGRLAAALVAVHPLLVWFSQEARVYALVALFAALSLVGFLRVLDRPTRRAWAAWAVPVGARAGHALLRRLPRPGRGGLAHLALPARPAHGARGRRCGRVAVALAPARPGPALDRQHRLHRRGLGLHPARAGPQAAAHRLRQPRPGGHDRAADRSRGRWRRPGWRPRDRPGRARVLLVAGLGVAAIVSPVLLVVPGLDYLNTRNVLAALPVLLVALAGGLALPAHACRAGRWRRPPAACCSPSRCWSPGATSTAATTGAGSTRPSAPGRAARALVVSPGSGWIPLGLYDEGLRPLPAGGAPCPRSPWSPSRAGAAAAAATRRPCRPRAGAARRVPPGRRAPRGRLHGRRATPRRGRRSCGPPTWPRARCGPATRRCCSTRAERRASAPQAATTSRGGAGRASTTRRRRDRLAPARIAAGTSVGQPPVHASAPASASSGGDRRRPARRRRARRRRRRARARPAAARARPPARDARSAPRTRPP